MIAYLVAQLVDVHVFHFWKRATNNKHLWLRNNGSTLVSQLVDTTAVILITHFYARALPVDAQEAIWPQLGVFILTGYVFKAAMAAIGHGAVLSRGDLAGAVPAAAAGAPADAPGGGGGRGWGGMKGTHRRDAEGGTRKAESLGMGVVVRGWLGRIGVSSTRDREVCPAMPPSAISASLR
ncbi:MAG: queuosine precursor transporter [Phycisphaerales bacterium]